ncbi:MAG: hypothetical protein ACREH8_14930 [Opitutaceae bacterium]
MRLRSRATSRLTTARSIGATFPGCTTSGRDGITRNPDTIKMTIGDLLVVVTGHSLSPLSSAIEDHTLVRVCAHPKFEGNVDHDADSFAIEIRFMKAPDATKRKGQAELDFGLE